MKIIDIYEYLDPCIPVIIQQMRPIRELYKGVLCLAP